MFLEKGFPIAIIFFMVNAGLLVMDIPSDRPDTISGTIFANILPEGLRNPSNLDPTQTNPSTDITTEGFESIDFSIGILGDLVGAAISFVNDVLKFGLTIVNVFDLMLFGFTYLLLAILPNSSVLIGFVWVISIPIVLLEIGAMFGFFTYLVSTIRGLLPV